MKTLFWYLPNAMMAQLFLTAILVSTAFLPSPIHATNILSMGKKSIATIDSIQQLQQILDASEGELLIFDLYADWCNPCKTLSPMLEKMAHQHSSRAKFYKINVDKHPQIATAFGVQGIPLVVFVKNKTAVSALTGLQPEQAYLSVIDQHSY